MSSRSDRRGDAAAADTVLWTLAKNGHHLEAAQTLVEVLGRVEPRISIDGSLFYARVHRTMGELLEEAREERAEAEGRGWAEQSACLS
jgi:hypothetical protein